MADLSAWVSALPQEHPGLAAGLAIGLAMGVLSLIGRWLPAPLRRQVERLQAGAQAVVRVLASGITMVVLACGYLLAIAPVALWWKVTRRDPLRRSAYAARESRWRDAPRMTDSASSARRQF
jgi:hypothetical protein